MASGKSKKTVKKGLLKKQLKKLSFFVKKKTALITRKKTVKRPAKISKGRSLRAKNTPAPEFFEAPHSQRKPDVVDFPPRQQNFPLSLRRVQDIPSNYGDNMIYLMVRDPFWLYTYWEIQGDHEQKALNSLGGDRNQVRSVLRVYDVTERDQDAPYFDITLGGMASCWFVNVQSNRTYFIDIGLLHHDGRFVVLARSNRVTTPRSGMSEVLDEQWMGIDFDKIYALSGGFQVGKSSLELGKLMTERLMKAVSSGSGGASTVRIAERQRGFSFWLDCELVVYGGTEPDAKVVFQGKEVKLRPDGTFSFRFALPDGKITLDAVAVSADGVEERKIIPVVERNTDRPTPVLHEK